MTEAFLFLILISIWWGNSRLYEIEDDIEDVVKELKKINGNDDE